MPPGLLGAPLPAPGGPACAGPHPAEGGPKLPPGGKEGTLPAEPGRPLGGNGGTPGQKINENNLGEGSRTYRQGRSLGEAWSLGGMEEDRQEAGPWLPGAGCRQEEMADEL